MKKTRTIDIYTRQWIIENALEEIQNYEPGELTIRGLHYRLVARKMPNTKNHYQRVKKAMTAARWNDQLPFETFSDHERAMLGRTEADPTSVEAGVDRAKRIIDHLVDNYYKNQWENQPIYPEVFIEKKALQGIFQDPCQDLDVALGACKGYPSLTFLNNAAKRFQKAIERGKEVVILYFGDYDPSGEDIPRSINETLLKFGIQATIKRMALMENQVIEWNLPPAPTNEKDPRNAEWRGLGQVELDAVEPKQLKELCRQAIEAEFDPDLHLELEEAEAEESKEYRIQLKNYINDELTD